MAQLARRIAVPVVLAAFLGALPIRAEEPAPAHGVAMHGDVRYGPGFEHFEYVNPDAPKGDSLSLSAIGSFDTLNPYVLRGVAAAGLGLVYDTLTQRSNDEPFTEYGLVAESIIMPEDRSWVAFDLRPEARWHDGRPITVEDVIWTFETLKTKGHPFYRAYYADVKGAEKIGEHRVKFTWDGGINRELPLIMGQLPVLPKHWYESRDFERSFLDPPLGSGPYRVARVDAGRSITYERVADYWGAELPVNRGRYNFDRVRYEYYRDADVALEAFKAGQYDLRIENSARNWAVGYDGPALQAGLIVKEALTDESGDGMQAYVFNTRREIFQDPRVRRALAYAFDFEWTNANFFYGSYARTESYFSNSELAATELPDERELRFLEPFRDRLPAELFERVYAAPRTDGSGNIREQLRTAFELLKEAGWEVNPQTRQLTHSATGRPMTFEILLVSPAFERITGPFIQNLQRLGVNATMRTVDTAQYQNRVDAFDFDMVVTTWGQSLSPGNEQRDFWSCAARDLPGSRNLAGICDPVVDALIEAVIRAESREELVAATRALDRVLLWGHHVIPQWHSRETRIAYWDKFDRPAISARYGVDLFSWWVDPQKAAQLGQRRASPQN
jgi:microcin C transport system substrate-binding protein